MLLIDDVVSNWDAILAVLTPVHALALEPVNESKFGCDNGSERVGTTAGGSDFFTGSLAVVNLTPTPTDNERLKSVYAKIELLAGLVTHKAKQ
jgi:hypothetical protein